MRDLLDSFSMIMIIVVVMELALLGLGIHSYVEKKNNIELVKAEGYECYLDGEEIDINTVDLSQYSCIFDKENKTVYMTTKSNNRTVVVPFFVR